MSKFNVGDEVFSIRSSWITVRATEDCFTYPIITSDRNSFTPEGKSNRSDLVPSLFTKAEALAKFPEFPPPKKYVKRKGYISISKYLNGDLVNTSSVYFEICKVPIFERAQIIVVEIEVEE